MITREKKQLTWSSAQGGRVRSCKLCNAPGASGSFVSYRGPVFRCPNCQVYFVDYDEQTPTDQDALFYSTVDETTYRSYFEPFRKGQYRHVLQGLGLPPCASLLDVGASYGWMVEVGLELGLESYGLEPGFADCRPAVRGRIARAALDDYDPGRTFDVVTIWHVLEHLQEPLTAIRKMYDLLPTGGRLVIAVPSSDGRMFRLGLLMERLLGRKRLLNELFYFHNPNMHFFYYNETSVLQLLRYAGFNPVSARTIEAFDWTTIYRRVARPVRRQLLRLLGPLVSLSRFTRRENLIVVAQK
jgi:2-polyprenyl-6-hydroxyphenyl methylase/3-demethylubiquinone-9 3-methyltransferase